MAIQVQPISWSNPIKKPIMQNEGILINAPISLKTTKSKVKENISIISTENKPTSNGNAQNHIPKPSNTKLLTICTQMLNAEIVLTPLM